MALARKLASAPAPRPLALPEGVSLARVADQLRRPFLEALPIAAAIVEACPGAPLKVVDANVAFETIAGTDLFIRCSFSDRLRSFFGSSDAVVDLEWIDGDAISGRCYAVRAARLARIDGVAPRVLLTLVDRTAERASEQTLRREMFSDSLTGLLNRAGFGDALETSLADAAPGGHAVLVVDLARFSRINESIGPLAGDELLITVARRLLSALRGGDILARMGGNEFALYVALSKGPEEALAIARRIGSVLAAPCRLSDLEIRVEGVVGCAVLEPGCDGDELIRRAQFAVKRAKVTGEPQVYQPRAFDLARRHFSLETQLRRAIEADRLTLAFQPIIELDSGQVAGFEALARWREDGQDVPPGTFIPVAEDSGLIVPLGRWALHAAVRTLRDWDAMAGHRTEARMNVNLSSLQIARDDVPALVAESLSAQAIDPARLTLEITESALIADPVRAARTLDRIRETGATLALDDFGTGYSNLANLQRLPLDVLKIDQSFITGMLGDRDKLAIVRAILSLARALGLKTTAEGVETRELAETLAALGCTGAQGYFYAAPLEGDAAFAYWSRSLAATSSAS
ncbi:bifunctional diguanylate cyclase/phosphodiesterase [Sphingomonas sp. ID1715]|uniref:putative bifunctional diguanylate cyclase/phosphodiesterase n=1 Tax=Sphingomonas sp. ID1715 TaxID=1656898 RepID=UPI00148812CF|nr:bifunctional diguanylate cyclase/phosphodiesterase [Sphingomonas sp. ID1715]NNM76962.1 bifunctional diguanylate cyclase/phosphodiesterase [Sphingomonas sp. ID1715]